MPPRTMTVEKATYEHRLKSDEDKKRALEEAQWRAQLRKEERKISFRLKKMFKKLQEMNLSHEAESVCLCLILLLTSVAAHAWITTAWLIYIR